MYPELLKIGPITVYSYGLMLGIAFLVANQLLAKEVKRQGKDPSLATNVTMLALVGGIVGAKLFHVLENWSDFLRDPIGMVFSSGGLTFYGGLIVAILLVYIYTRKKKLPMLRLADMVAPALALAYGIGRIGCQLAGDGDYGIPTDLPWAMSYENGTVPTAFVLDQAGHRVPTEWVHPTPLYEFLTAAIIFTILFLRRKRPLAAGNQFGLFLILHSTSRFLVEFIRVNPRFLSLSEAQWISIGLIAWGVYLLVRTTAARGKPRSATAS